ncbi:TonB-dependent siderophore receptor [uncultured Campylobacter sp.]|uniref:TonB-dependent siderophore receptor n=1 Tax=uncultured Campylobacter sp. TaxID=218934 RepID=UPI00263879AB|nr:TonB-dependent siderophore receptor [uncultured Campylobacter sp.]
MKFKMSFGATLALFSFACAEQNAAASSASGENLGDIEVVEWANNDDGYRAVRSEIGKTTKRILEIPQTVNVVTQQHLKDKKPETLAESLQNVSGISYANTTGNIFDAIIKRGFGEGRDGSIMRNGVPGAVMHNYNKTIQSVEVLKGPASMLYGAQQPGGVINMVTKKPQYEFINEIWGGLGNRNYWDAGFDTTGPIADSGFAYRFIFDYYAKDYWRNFGGIKNTLFAPSLAYQGDDYSISLGYTHSRSTDPVDRGAFLVPSTGKIYGSGKVRFDEPVNKLQSKLDTVDFGFEKEFNEDWILKGAYAFSRSKHEYGYVRPNNPFTPQGLTGTTRSYNYYDNFIHRTHAASVTLNGKFETGPLKHDVLFGTDYKNYYRYRPGALKGTAGRINMLTGQTASGAVLTNDREPKIQYQKLRTIGLYTQDNINLTDELILSLGVRREFYDQVAKQSWQGPNSTDQKKAATTYQGGLLYLLSPQWSVYTNYAQSFTPQMSIGEAIGGDLKPEEGKSVELGTKFQNDRVTAGAAVFNIDKRNILRTVNNISETIGKARSRGFELDINGRVTQGLSMSASYAYTKTRVREDDGAFAVLIGKPLEATPKHQASLFANYDFAHLGAKGLRLGGGARYFGSWYTYYMRTNLPNVPAGTTFKLPHAVVYDAFVSYDTKISGYNTNFSFNVKNLTDKKYYTSSSTGTTTSVIPIQMGYARQFMFNVSVKF